jgi:hypothetical protein
MINLYSAQIMDDDKHQKVEKAQLIKIAEQIWKDRTRQRLAKFASGTLRSQQDAHLHCPGCNAAQGSLSLVTRRKK